MKYIFKPTGEHHTYQCGEVVERPQGWYISPKQPGSDGYWTFEINEYNLLRAWCLSNFLGMWDMNLFEIYVNDIEDLVKFKLVHK